MMDNQPTPDERRFAVRRPTRNGIRRSSTIRTTRRGRAARLGIGLAALSLLCTFFANMLNMGVAGSQTMNNGTDPSAIVAPTASNGSEAPTPAVDPATNAPLPAGSVTTDATSVDKGTEAPTTTEPQAPVIGTFRLPKGCLVNVYGGSDYNDPWTQDPGVITVGSADDTCIGQTFQWSVNQVGVNSQDQHPVGSVVTVTLGSAGDPPQTISSGVSTPLCVQSDTDDVTGKNLTNVIRQPQAPGYDQSTWTGGPLPTPDQCVPGIDLTVSDTVPATPPPAIDLGTASPPAVPVTPTVPEAPPIAPPTTVPEQPTAPTTPVGYTCEELLKQGKSLACTGVSDTVVIPSIFGSDPVTLGKFLVGLGAFAATILGLGLTNASRLVRLARRFSGVS